MSNTFFIADTHFFHENILNFESSRSHMGRTVEEMNEYIIERWNEAIGPDDIVYHLGDFTFKVKSKYNEICSIGSRLKGHKILVLGNHDRSYYKKEPHLYTNFGFSVVHEYPLYLYTRSKQVLLSHEPVPFAESSVHRNIHGHLHSKKVIQGINTGNHDDPVPQMSNDFYYNASIEQLPFNRPVPLEDILTLQ